MLAQTDLIEKAFTPNQALKKRVFEAISETPKHQSLFEDIASYTLSLQDSAADQPPAKKRKVDQNGDSTGTQANSLHPSGGLQRGSVEENSALEFEMPDISFSIPVRKKLKLEMWGGGFAARDQKTSNVEWNMHRESFQYAFRLPVPEKAQKQTMFILLSQSGTGIRGPPLVNDIPNPEPALFTVPDNPKAQAAALVADQKKADLPEARDDIASGRPLEGMLKAWVGAHRSGSDGLIEPSEEEFASAVPEAHRKGEKAYHVRAFRGTKDGFLFFLRTGLLFTPKKPLLFFPFSAIKSISYSSVVQRTFSLNVSVYTTVQRTDGDEGFEVDEFEFSHVDQADFAGIDGWVKRHGLDDESLAVQRRAKIVTVNKKRGAPHQENGESELSKAERELEGRNADGEDGEAGEGAEEEEEERDSEDEREEDYDPGSEGESEGSGTSDESDEEDDRNRRGRSRAKGGRNLVEEELGSEAEDVSDEDEEEGGEEEEEEGEEEEEEEEGEGEGKAIAEVEVKSGTAGGAKATIELKVKGGTAAEAGEMDGPSYDDEDQL